MFRRTGITFAVYGDEQADERLIPFRHRPADHFRERNGAALRRGIEQRVLAINAFWTISITGRKS